ncbi:unnamed protein product (mitochondrion) [Plasmodiophora brassicae]|uniref:RING-type domain-containing protein n=1 Tax=Plasmodiophora brassicae TaxID=37360 RepID=A0A3P3XYK0_PLABS|nr:unnamed protein product [Plasmodiophora brassicae]
MSNDHHLTCRLKPVLLSLLLIVHLEGFGEAISFKINDGGVYYLRDDLAVMHSEVLRELVYSFNGISGSSIMVLHMHNPNHEACDVLVQYMAEVHNYELEVTRRWILDKLSWAQPPDMITQLVEAAYYCLEMPLFIVAVGVTIPVPGTGETALQIGTVRQPMALAPGIECVICSESDGGAATSLDCGHDQFHTGCIIHWLLIHRVDWNLEAYFDRVFSQWLTPPSW